MYSEVNLRIDNRNQVYHWADFNKEIISPQIGNLLQRTRLHDNQTDIYVVYKIGQRKSKNNPNVISTAYLYPVQYYDPKTESIGFKADGFPLTLNLSGVGTWFTKDMQKKYEWKWLNYLPYPFNVHIKNIDDPELSPASPKFNLSPRQSTVY